MPVWVSGLRAGLLKPDEDPEGRNTKPGSAKAPPCFRFPAPPMNARTVALQRPPLEIGSLNARMVARRRLLLILKG